MNAETQMLSERPSVGEQERLQQNWVLLLAMGVALIVIGAAVVSEPEMTFVATNVVVQVLGMLLVLGGIFQVAGSLWAGSGGDFSLHLLAGVFYLVIGVLMIGRTDEAAAALTLMVAAALLVGGVFRIVLSVSPAVRRLGLGAAQRRRLPGPRGGHLEALARFGRLGDRPLRRDRNAVRRAVVGDARAAAALRAEGAAAGLTTARHGPARSAGDGGNDHRPGDQHPCFSHAV